MSFVRLLSFAGAASAALLLSGVALSEPAEASKAGARLDWDVEHNQIVVHAAGHAEVRITPSGKLTRWPVLSPSGDWVAYSQEDGDRDIRRSWRTPSSLWKVKVDGTAQTKLLGARRSPKVKLALSGFSDVCWSRDGAWLYFAADGNVHLSPYDVGTIHRVRPDGSNESFVAFGDSLWMVRGGKYDGYLITTRRLAINDHAERDRAIIVRPDGRWERVVAGTNLVTDGGDIEPLYRWLRDQGAEAEFTC